MMLWKFVLPTGPVWMSQRQYIVALLIVVTSCALLWIIAHAALDLLGFVIFKFTRSESFVPRSWLIVLAASLWSVLVPSRGQVAGATPEIGRAHV